MAELEIHFMGLLMPKMGMRPYSNIPCNSAGDEPLYFGARMSYQSFGKNTRTLRDLSELLA
ncbi:hypothetical protein POS17_0127 [Pseudomonas sp. Os17]|nr:hypothetical protein POS17_0127 [Pseudomonas sp. Os17]BAQ78014.1 hypothetical protein PST29_0125 [Pseudomonas sp. St29]